MTWVFLVNYQQHPGSERAYGAWSRGRSADKAGHGEDETSVHSLRLLCF